MATTPEKFTKIEKELNEYFVERREPIHGLNVATISGSNILYLGTPGVGKSLIVNAYSKHVVQSTYFAWLLTKYSTPEELFGPYSMQGLKNDEYRRVSKNRLPDAFFVLLDEIFKGNSAILNSLLTVMNERVWYNNGVATPTNLVTLVGCSNERPEKEDGLDAMYDRFHLKYNVRPIQEHASFRKLFNSDPMGEPKSVVTSADIMEAQKQSQEITFSQEISQTIVQLWATLKNEAIIVTDRTFMAAKKIIQAEAWLRGHAAVQLEDLEILSHCFWSDERHEKKVFNLILELVSPEKGKIYEEWDKLKSLAESISKSDKDRRKATELATEFAVKSKQATKTMQTQKNMMAAKNLDLTEVNGIFDKVAELRKSILMEYLAADITA